MRIPIRIQLGSLILLSSLIGLAVLSIAVWLTVQDFVLKQRGTRLALTAALKAGQLDSNLEILQTATSFVSSRIVFQYALQRYNNNANNTASNWFYSIQDMQAAIGGESSLGQSLLMQTRVWAKNASGPAGASPLLDATAASSTQVSLPYTYPNGTSVKLGDNSTEAGPWGFPPPLYPNLTYSTREVDGFEVSQASYNGVTIAPKMPLLLGPFDVNSSFSMISLTTAIVNATNPYDTLGYLTTVMNASLIYSVMDSREGLGDTGETLVLGPADITNRFPAMAMAQSDANQEPNFEVRFVLPLNDSEQNRHPDHVYDSENANFNATEFPVVYSALARAAQNASDSSGANVRATNEDGQKVSIGYAKLQTSIVDWIIIVELKRGEVWQPIDRLRDVILACVFATAGFMAIVAFPLAHFASLPIIRLRSATRKSVEAPGKESRSSLDESGSVRDGSEDDNEDSDMAITRQEKWGGPIKQRWKRKRDENVETRRERQKRAFRIPARVKERKYWIRDELSELTRTFNEMSDELMLQYSSLEERVQQRTAELELSKKAAEAANESKTLFIANISHELKTPLNGILGMCAVCMQEDDPFRLKRSLGIIYKSGDLLLNLLTDLLTFSKNQVGQSLSLDEKEFRLRDISSQILAIFDKQAKEGNIDLRVEYDGIHDIGNDSASPERYARGPPGTGRMRDMILWGDVHRILQVVINLVSNSLKFTPAGGSVVLTVRCLPEIPEIASRPGSMNSKQSKQRSSRHRASDSSLSVAHTNPATANAINVKDKPHALAYFSAHERTVSPPPGRFVNFEFEVTDTGPGIPENLLDKIFEPFVQGDLGLSKKYGGTGLGLSICSQLATLMRGAMSVRSTVGMGSSFKMKIPLRHLQSRADSSASSAVLDKFDGGSRRSSIDDGERADSHGPVDYHEDLEFANGTPATAKVTGNLGNESKPRLVGLRQPFFAASQPLESPGSQGAAMKKITDEATRSGKLRVLVAEDNKVNQEVVLRMLKLEDIYDVTVARDGQEALDLVKESMRGGDSQPYNLIFMDVQMPNVDGLESTRLIREIGYEAPIVALTAFAEESNIKDCYDSGMNYFLSKPIRRPQLKKVLNEYCAPIPEEDSEDATPEEEGRRGSAVNTTIVVVNSRVSNESDRPLFEATTNSTTRSSHLAEEPRPVSPKCVA